MEFPDLFDSFDLIVEKILSYVDDCTSLSLTCKTVYRAVSRNKKFRLRIDQNKLHDNFDSITKTGRSFDEIFLHNSKPRDLYDINLEQSFEQMQEISKVFGWNISKAKIYCPVFSSSHFTSFINNMPCLRELHVHEVCVYDLPDGEFTWPSVWPRGGLNLKNLTILKVSECGEDFLSIIRDCVLEKVSLRNSTSSRNDEFFERQTHIKELSLDSLADASNKLRNLRLQVLSVFSGQIEDSDKLSDQDKDELLRSIKSQPSLTKLNIYGFIDRSILTAISTHLKHLKSLSFDFDGWLGDIIDLVSSLDKLANLEELCVRASNLQINSLTATKKPQIKKLFLDVNKGSKRHLYRDDLIAIQRAFPSLLELGLSNCDFQNVYVLLDVFTSIVTLNLRMYGSLFLGDPFTMIVSERCYKNIKKFFFSFHDPDYDPIDKKFLDVLYRMPNLEILELWKRSYFDKGDLILAIKTNLPKLKRINIFETNSPDRSTREGSTVSLHMFEQHGFALHEHF